MKIVDSFKVGILQHKVSNYVADKVENLLIPRLDQLSNKDNMVNTDYFHKKQIFELNEIPELVEEIYKCKDYFNQTLKSHSVHHSKICGYWVQDYRNDKDHHVRHNHGKNELSVVYWVRADKNAGPLVIYNPIPLQSFLYSEASEPRNEYTTAAIKVSPEKGGIVMFPSCIDHSVFPSETKNCIRTTIAFNLDLYK
tara:strand:+ start:117 stop:704 length:588 start_codon:yes stop_codon:yes gene_type:complete